MYITVYLSVRNAALLGPAVIIKLTMRRRERGIGDRGIRRIHCKKRLSFFLSPAGLSNQTLKLFMAGNNLIIFPARESLVSDILVGDGKIGNLFYSV